MRGIFLSILLVVVAILLFSVLFPFAILWSVKFLFFDKKRKNWKFEVSQWFYAWALSIDQLANVVCKELFNSILINKTGVRFGNPDETISGVLGKNKRSKTLSKIGKSLVYILNKIDPNHTIKSIEDDE